MSTEILKSPCVVCSVPCSQNCGHCKKTFYCGKEHQKLHRKTHKEDCFPAVLYRDPVIGQHWIASRDIHEGETIFNEYPIIVGPSGALPEFRPICLGCFKYVNKLCYCSNCQWPVCNSTCEKEPFHTKLECKILSENKIPAPTKPDQYQHIFILRCLLQRDLQPDKWALVTTLEAHVEDRKDKIEDREIVNSLYNFIHTKCKLNDFDFDIVNYVYGAVKFNSYSMIRFLKASGVGAQLYFKLGKLNHSCVENSVALDLEPKSGCSPISRGLTLTAAVDIKKGEALTQLYGDTMQGTYDRQRFLESEYYFTCSCKRCIDPTELGTYYSAIKCKADKCQNGYLLPLNPQDPQSVWKCNKCKKNQEYHGSISKIIDKISAELKIIYDQIHQGTTTLQDQVTLNQKLEQFLKKYEGSVVHSNHFTLVPIKLRNLQETYEILSIVLQTDKNDTNLKAQMVRLKEDIDKKLSTANDMLKVFDKLNPGNSPVRHLLQKFLEDYKNLQNKL